MNNGVNYILHHKNVNMAFFNNKEVRTIHISIYNALFLIWNNCGFCDELSINRNDIMKLAKVGNSNTYTRCLKELDKLGFIKYQPSYNPLIGSKVTIIRYDKGTDKGTDKGSSKGTDKGSDTLYKLLNNKTIELINNNASLVNKHLESWINDYLSKEFNPKKSLLDYGFENQLVNDYLKIRKDKKATLTKTAFDNLIREIEKTGKDKNEVLKLIVVKGWLSFKASWDISEAFPQEQQRKITHL